MCPCYRVKSIEKSNNYKAVYGVKRGHQEDDATVTEQPRRSNKSGGGGGNYIERVTNDQREDEMEENLQ